MLDVSIFPFWACSYIHSVTWFAIVFLTCSAQPPDDLLWKAKNASKFFKKVGSIYHAKDDEACKRNMSAYRVLGEEEYEAVSFAIFQIDFSYSLDSDSFFYQLLFNLIQRESEKPLIGKRYFNFIKLEDIVVNYPYRKNLSEDELSKGWLSTHGPI